MFLSATMNFITFEVFQGVPILGFPESTFLSISRTISCHQKKLTMWKIRKLPSPWVERREIKNDIARKRSREMWKNRFKISLYFHNCLNPNCFSNISALKVPSMDSQFSLKTLYALISFLPFGFTLVFMQMPIRMDVMKYTDPNLSSMAMA